MGAGAGGLGDSVRLVVSYVEGRRHVAVIAVLCAVISIADSWLCIESIYRCAPQGKRRGCVDGFR